MWIGQPVGPPGGLGRDHPELTPAPFPTIHDPAACSLNGPDRVALDVRSLNDPAQDNAEDADGNHQALQAEADPRDQGIRARSSGMSRPTLPTHGTERENPCSLAGPGNLTALISARAV